MVKDINQSTAQNKPESKKSNPLPKILLTATGAIVVACGGDDGPVTPPTPPVEKGTNNAPTMNLPDTMRFDLKDKPTNADFNQELLKLIADDNTPDAKLNITTTPTPDLNKEGITTVKVTATDDGKDSKGKIGKEKSSSANTVVKVTDGTEVVANFPSTLPGSDNDTLTAGDVDFFKNLFAHEFTLSDNSKVTAEKILVNGLEVDNTHTINKPGSYKISVTVKDTRGKEHTHEWTATANYKEAIYGELNNKKDYEILGIEVDENTMIAQSRSSKWLRKGVDNNEKYGYFRAKIAIDELNPEWKNNIENELRKRKVGRISHINFSDFSSEQIEDSDGKSENRDDHDEAQLRNRFGEVQVGLMSKFNLGKKNGEYLVRTINEFEYGENNGITEIEDNNLQDIVSSVAGEAQIQMDRKKKERYNPETGVAEDGRENRLNGKKKTANKLAEGKIKLDIIMTNADWEIVTWNEGKAVDSDYSGKAITNLSVLLEANPAAAKNIRLVTFDRTGGDESDTNGRLSQKLATLFKNNGGKIYYAPSMMVRLSADEQTPNTFTYNTGYTNNNSRGSVRYMGDLRMVDALQNLGIEGIEFNQYTDPQGSGTGEMLNYDSLDDALYARNKLTDQINLSANGTFKFADFLPSELKERYGEKIQINTPWAGWITINENISTTTLQGFNLNEGFTIGIKIEGETLPWKIKDWNPDITIN